ncbi:fimbrial assembly protein [Paraburkholderia sp. CNPSo 3157]|uniref:Fimbrial assembly protein n=1 Tax=Paraburkholderia franconis TaxID=2654983 RepID=A0A7X1NFY3_9BURK|nr:fimbrial assembly protein [Paraburkholderia franconis]MPW21227.1 fimbrial assembly protein [Paraburkholderia franconis]
MNATRIKVGGFNLLPHRQRDARLARRRRYVEWTAAALCGCVAVAVLVGWQAFERTRIDRQRADLDGRLAALASPLAEHARLTGEASNERLQNERAATLSEPLVHLLDLLDALSQEPSDTVVVKQLRQRGRDTEMLAVSTDHAAASAWLNRLAALRGVKDASLSDLHRTASATESSTAIELTANLKWDGPPGKAKASASVHQKTRGEK